MTNSSGNNEIFVGVWCNRKVVKQYGCHSNALAKKKNLNKEMLDSSTPHILKLVTLK